jgi:acetoin utilization protein AcuC
MESLSSVSNSAQVLLVTGEAIANYGFGDGHPFGTDRHDAFVKEFSSSRASALVKHAAPRPAARDELEMFHKPQYVEFVRERSNLGQGSLDGGDTPAQRGIYEAACNVVGATLVAVEAVMSGAARRAFIPIAGLHHAARDHAAGFCVFNDCGVAIEVLRRKYGLKRIAYVDIDAHHGDGVFYGFVGDADIAFADLHEDGRFLYPGTGAAEETGLGAAQGTKLNIPMAPGATDDQFFSAWEQVEQYLNAIEPEFVILQAGADSLGGDPITHLRYTEKAHAHAARRLTELAERWGHGRVVGTGGGGYNRRNLARAWTRVVEEFVGA